MSLHNITSTFTTQAPTNIPIRDPASNTTDPTPQASDNAALALRISLIVLVFLLAVTGNGGIGILLRRFKSLRTVPNILVGNLAFIDFMNATVNLPVFLAAGVLQLKNTGGRLTSATIFASQTLVIFLHLLSMLLMMVDRYVAIAWGLHYRAWKSQRKVLLAIITVWTIVFGATVPWVFILYSLDRGEAGYLIYHTAYFHHVGKYNCFVTYPILGCAIGVVSALTYRSIKKQGKFYAETKPSKKGRNALNDARQRNEVRAAQTFAITIFLYGVCLVPCLMYCSLMATPKFLPSNKGEEWFVYLVVLSFYIPSALCPYIYVIRTTRFRRALFLFYQDPCGDTDFGAMIGSSTAKVTSSTGSFALSWRKMKTGSQRDPSSSLRDHDSITLETDRAMVSMETVDGNENPGYGDVTLVTERVAHEKETHNDSETRDFVKEEQMVSDTEVSLEVKEIHSQNSNANDSGECKGDANGSINECTENDKSLSSNNRPGETECGAE